MNPKKLFVLTTIAISFVIGIAYFIVISHLVYKVDIKKLLEFTTTALLLVNGFAYFFVSSHRIEPVNTKKLLGFSSIALLSVIGIVHFIVNSNRIDLEPLYLSKFSTILESKGYNIRTISYTPKNKEITVQLSNKEPNFDNAKKEIKNLIKNELIEDNLMDLSVKLEIKDFEKDKIESQ